MIAFITYTMQIVMSFLMLGDGSRYAAPCRVWQPTVSTRSSRRRPPSTTPMPPLPNRRWNAKTGMEKWSSRNVSFRYPGAATATHWEHITFTARPGETTALIGSTGCGKSTLLNLIPTLYDATGGAVCIDAADDVRDYAPGHAARPDGAIVRQKGVLFSGTIDSNLKLLPASISPMRTCVQPTALPRPPSLSMPSPRVMQAPLLRAAAMSPAGRSSVFPLRVPSPKSRASTCLDDSFSALDYKTDVALRRALKAQTDNATVIIVAQRISTVLHANRILVLDDGCIVGDGTPRPADGKLPEYQEIARSQLSQKD